MPREPKFAPGDHVVVAIASPRVFVRYGKYQNLTGTILQRKCSGEESLYLVDFDEGPPAWLPSPTLYHEGVELPEPPPEEHIALAKAVRKLQPGDTFLLGKYSAALPANKEAETTSMRNLEGQKATLLRRGFHENVIEVEGIPGRWVLPTLSMEETEQFGGQVRKVLPERKEEALRTIREEIRTSKMPKMQKLQKVGIDPSGEENLKEMNKLLDLANQISKTEEKFDPDEYRWDLGV